MLLFDLRKVDTVVDLPPPPSPPKKTPPNLVVNINKILHRHLRLHQQNIAPALPLLTESPPRQGGVIADHPSLP